MQHVQIDPNVLAWGKSDNRRREPGRPFPARSSHYEVGEQRSRSGPYRTLTAPAWRAILW